MIKLNYWEVCDFVGISPKTLGRYSRFSGGLLLTHDSAQTAFVKAVIQCSFNLNYSSVLHH